MKHSNYLIFFLLTNCSGDFSSASNNKALLSDSGFESQSLIDSSKKPNPRLEMDVVQETSSKDVHSTNEASLPRETDSDVPQTRDSGIPPTVVEAGIRETGAIDSTPEETSTPVATCKYCHLNSSHKQLCCTSPVSNICWLDDSQCESWF